MNHQKFKISIGIIGDTYTGKTSILNVFNDNNFEISSSPTNGLSFIKKVIKKNNENINILFIDLPGKEIYRKVALSMIKNALGIIVVYSITNKLSFENCKKWLKDLNPVIQNTIPVFVIGNKCDLNEKREVLKEEGENFSKENNFSFFESSALNKINIHEPINKLIDIILSQNWINIPYRNINLNSTTLNILLLGDNFTGKSNLKNSININYVFFIHNYKISIKIKFKEMNFESKERDEIIKQVSGIILCISLDNIKSFRKLKEWIKTSEINVKNLFFIPKLLIGNKNDNKTIVIPSDEINYLSNECFLQYYENYDNVKFNSIFQNFIYEMILCHRENTININEYKVIKKSDIIIFKSIYPINTSLNFNYEFFGKIFYDNGNKGTYKGFIINGKREKKGIMEYPNNYIYIGNWLNDEKSGYGIIINKKVDNLEKNNKKKIIKTTFQLLNEEKYNDLFQRNGFYFNNIIEIYKGYFKNNKKEGLGEFLDENGNYYKGNWENDKKNGEGEIEYNITKIINNNVLLKCKIYKGEWKDDKWNGKGTIILEDGRLIEGYFINDTINISKNYKIYYKNGNIYYGLIDNDFNKNGIGELIYFNGNFFKGNWKNDLKNGKGKYEYNNESIFDGEWENDKIINGLFYSDKNDYENLKNEEKFQNFEKIFIKNLIKGIIYGGTFINENLNGGGIYILPNEYCYVGDFIDNKKNGNGRMISKEGNIYCGEWVNDKKEGYGTMNYQNKDSYIGSWKNDKIEGEGMYILKNGNSIHGNKNYSNNDWIFIIKKSKMKNEYYTPENNNENIIIRNKRYGNNKIKPILKSKIR